MARTGVTDPQFVEDSSEIRKLTSSINRLTWILAGLTVILILLALPVAVESIRDLLG